MRLKIVFSEPPEQEFKVEQNEKIMIIPSQYKVLQDKLGDTTARLVMMEDVIFFKNNKSILKTIRDDSLIGLKPNRLLSRLAPPTFFFQSATHTLYNHTPAQVILKNFFSEETQQQNDYTYGPAVIKEVAS